MCKAPKPKTVKTPPSEVLSNPLLDGRRGAVGLYLANRTGRSGLVIPRNSGVTVGSGGVRSDANAAPRSRDPAITPVPTRPARRGRHAQAQTA